MPADPVDVEGYVTLIAELRAEIETTRKAERERLAAWFMEHGDEIKALASDGLSVESVAFLLRMAGE